MFKKKSLSALQRIVQHLIRGKNKVWIWNNYFSPSLHFHLMVDLDSEARLSTDIRGHHHHARTYNPYKFSRVNAKGKGEKRKRPNYMSQITDLEEA